MSRGKLMPLDVVRTVYRMRGTTKSLQQIADQFRHSKALSYVFRKCDEHGHHRLESHGGRSQRHRREENRGMYWAWITMLTIGYGDVVPMTTWGKVVGSVCAVIGLVFWSIPMTFVSDKFDLYRRLYKDRDYLMGLLQKLTSEAKEELQQESLMRQIENGPTSNVNHPLLLVSGTTHSDMALEDRAAIFRRSSSRKSVSLSALNHSCQPGSTSILTFEFGDDLRGIDGDNNRQVFGALGISLTSDSNATPHNCNPR